MNFRADFVLKQGGTHNENGGFHIGRLRFRRDLSTGNRCVASRAVFARSPHFFQETSFEIVHRGGGDL